MEFIKAAKLLIELRTVLSIQRARRMFGGPDEGEVNILNLRVRF